MPTVAGHEVDGKDAWRIAVFVVVAGGFVLAYRSTGHVLESIALALLGAVAVAVAVAAVSTLLRALQRAV